MNITVITGTVNCLPLLGFLKQNQLNVSLFNGFLQQNQEDFERVQYYCNSIGIPISKADDILQDWLDLTNTDLVFVLGYSKWIDLELIKPILHDKLFNIHFGPLPEFKGPNPLFWQLKKGGGNVGLSIHRINEKYDDGALVWSKNIPNEPHFSFGFLELVFSQVLIEGVSFILKAILKNEMLPDLKDPDLKSKYYKRPELKDVMIDWSSMTASEILNLIKACNPWNKGAITVYQGNELKIMDAELLSDKYEGEELQPGTIVSDNGIEVVCLGNEIIRCNFFNLNGILIANRFGYKIGMKKGVIFSGSL